MKILQQAPQKLVIGTPASAIFLVRLIGLAVSLPGLLVLAMSLFGGALDYSALNCQRHRPSEQQCRFLRISLVRPYFHQFAIDALTGVRRQQARLGSSSSQRLIFEIEGRSLPLTVYYSNDQEQQAHIASRVQEFLANPASSSLTVRRWPSWGSIVLIIVFFIPTLPLSLLIIVFAATSVTVSFDKGQRQLTVSQRGCWYHETKHCSLPAIDSIVVDHLVIDRSSRGKAAIERYPLFIVLHSGEKFFRFDYIQRHLADEIAQVMRQFLATGNA